MLGTTRFGRLLRIAGSRWFDYAGLRGASSVDEILAWHARTPDLQPFNRNSIRTRIVQAVFDSAGCELFIETGTSHAATTIGAHRYLGASVTSCEYSLRNYYMSRFLTAGMHGVRIWHQDSRAFMRSVTAWLRGTDATPFFYLDAHEGPVNPVPLPLVEEVRALLVLPRFVALIDDIRVPGADCFRWGTYGATALEIGLIAEDLVGAGIQRCYFPGYPPSLETGYVSGYCFLWRSPELDGAHRSGRFPFNQLRSQSLATGS